MPELDRIKQNEKKKHIFLTGEIQIGKSMLIKKVLKEVHPNTLGGFCTISKPDIQGTGGSVYLIKASEMEEKEPICQEENRVGIRRRPPIGFPSAFDQYGVAVLADAENSNLILMDEIGKMEREALLFSERILELLEGDVPVLGVVRKEGNTPLQEQIRQHPNVNLIEVTLENRNLLVEELTKLLSDLMMPQKDSGGAFVYRYGKEGLEILMIRGKKGWGFPKGKMEDGENLKQASVREAREETGIEIDIEGDFSYTVPSGKAEERRNVTYFIAKAIGGAISPQYSEVRDAEWVPADHVRERIWFPVDIPAWEAVRKRIEEMRK